MNALLRGEIIAHRNGATARCRHDRRQGFEDSRVRASAGVYRRSALGEPAFVEEPASTDETMRAVLYKIITGTLRPGLAGRARPLARPLARHKQSAGLFVSGLGFPHCRRPSRRPFARPGATGDGDRLRSGFSGIARSGLLLRTHLPALHNGLTVRNVASRRTASIMASHCKARAILPRLAWIEGTQPW